MKLSELLTNVGRPVVFHPGLAKRLGGVAPALFLENLLYWHGKEASADGWVYKTQDELEQETALSRKEQENARKVLRGLGLLQEKHVRLEHRLYYRLDLDALDKWWVSDIPETPNGHSGNAERTFVETPNGHSLKEHLVPSLKDSSLKQKQAPAAQGVVQDLPLALVPYKAAVEQWLAYKRERRQGYRPAGLKALFTKMAKLGAALPDALERAMANGWQGFDFAPKGSNQRTFEAADDRLEDNRSGDAELWGPAKGPESA